MKNRFSMSTLAALAVAVVFALGLAACGDDDDSGGGGGGGGDGGGGSAKTVALLLPETKTTRYEEKDRPLFTDKLKELCADCKLIYANASQDPNKQQQQAEAAITKGANVIVLDAVDVASVGPIVQRAKRSQIHNFRLDPFYLNIITNNAARPKLRPVRHSRIIRDVVAPLPARTRQLELHLSQILRIDSRVVQQE